MLGGVAPKLDMSFFEAHSVANKIVMKGKREICGSQMTPHKSLKHLLKDMGEYGARKWRYVPGNGQKHADNCLKGLEPEPDCQCLAEMFEMIAHALGFVSAKKREIKKVGHRVVTTAIPAFDGRCGDEDIAERWCFGNHWVVDFEANTYDPTYLLTYETGKKETAEAGFGWWAQEVPDTDLRHGSYYKHPTDPRFNIYVVPLACDRPYKPHWNGLCGLFASPSVTFKKGGYETFNRSEHGVCWATSEKASRWISSLMPEDRSDFGALGQHARSHMTK